MGLMPFFRSVDKTWHKNCVNIRVGVLVRIGLFHISITKSYVVKIQYEAPIKQNACQNTAWRYR